MKYLLLYFLFLSASLFAQQDSIKTNPTPWEILGNTYSQHNTTWTDSLKWYGSGDVNLDGVVNSADLQAMNNGSNAIEADVDGDGTPSTQNDKNVLTQYLNGSINYLPGHWNELTTPEEREDWFNKMILINDGFNGNPSGWVCADWIKQMELDFDGCANYPEGYAQGFWNPATNIDSVAKFNIPGNYFSDYNISGISHAVFGVLVGRRINPDSVSYNPLDFRDWDFRNYHNKSRVHPGDWDMNPNHSVTMYKNAYIIIRAPPFDNHFTSTGPWIKWQLNNGVPTLIYVTPSGDLVLENPNIIKVHCGSLVNIVLSGEDVSIQDTSLTPEILQSLGFNSIPDTTKENTVLPINLSYSNRDTTWNSDSTSFSFNRHFYAWIYSGGITKWDTCSQEITVNNIIGTQTKIHVTGSDSLIVDAADLPVGFNFTPEALDSLGYNAIPDTTKEHTDLPITLTYTDDDTTRYGESSYSFNRKFTASIYSFGVTLSDSLLQYIRIENIITGIEGSKILPADYSLSQNYPNPFNPATRINYAVPALSQVIMKVYDVLGNEVVTLVNDVKAQGSYEVNFNGLNLSSGIYFYRIDANAVDGNKHFSKVSKMLLLK